MPMPIPPLFRFAPFAAAILLLAGANANANPHAQVVTGKLHVSVEVVVSCRLEVNIPRAGTPNRAQGPAGFSATCTRGAVALASACAAECVREPGTADPRRTEWRVSDARADGTTVATLLF
jgi:hypothetical protein